MGGRAEEAEKHGRNSREGNETWKVEQRRQRNMEGRAEEAEKHGRNRGGVVG